MDEKALTAWRERTSAVMRMAMGETHVLTSRFEDIRYHPLVFGGGTDIDAAFSASRRSGIARAQALIGAAIFEVQTADIAQKYVAEIFDVELWSKVEHLVTGEKWDQLVTASVVFFEHWVRTRTGLPNSTIGVDLMKDAFKPGGLLALATGEAPSETQGWHLMATGMTMAVRNAAGHRIDDRPDGRTYAMGVLGTISLLMTQVRLEHPVS
jgi:hypothetical protein